MTDAAKTLPELSGQSAVCRDVIATVSDLLRDVSAMLENSGDNLSAQFQTLAAASQAQSEKVKDIVKHTQTLRSDGEEISLTAFTTTFEKTLCDAIDRIVGVSKTAMSLVFELTEAKSNLDTLNGCINKIQMINRQTNILAINAMIEAKRAGTAGGSFAIVANEMKEISREINDLTHSMRNGVGTMSKRIHDSYDSLQEVATVDLSDQIIAREKLNGLLRAILLQNEQFSVVLNDAAQTGQEITQNIRGMTVNMQFQDRSCQYLDNSIRMLEPVNEVLQKIETLEGAVTEKNTDNAAFSDYVASKCQLSELALRFKQKRGLATATTSTDANDSIELF